MITEIRWIKVFLILILTPQVKVTEMSSVIVRDGDDATLPCKNVIRDQNKCNATDWIISPSGKEVFTLGSIREDVEDKDRLSVTENCSLVIKKVTAADGVRYDCGQRISGQITYHSVYLSAVEMTESRVDDKVALSCSVSTCMLSHKAKCLYEDPNVAEDGAGGTTSQCTVTLSTSYLEQKPNYRDLFTCEVTDDNFQNVQRFVLSSQSSGEKQRTWLYVAVAVGLAALLITSVAVIRWKRNKGSKTQMDKNSGQGLKPAETQSGPETSRDKADPEDGVCYTSVSHIKKSNSDDRVRVKDGGDAVTYSTVKFSSSAGASSDVHATVNKPKPNRDHST
ncbi:uncharacterized protein LOC118099602 isoform X1 [Hippoglossus stenolepis]|uniref:uncharacterized protein LOC118099602 isoform X1 n=1 Tax=Hippoglossus stenolepis TaxID=195615 RepID=UPI001FAED888|nr:uncharacterized protein LOC118099602 isoform X1 [Hippoglossus stenolepis]